MPTNSALAEYEYEYEYVYRNKQGGAEVQALSPREKWTDSEPITGR